MDGLTDPQVIIDGERRPGGTIRHSLPHGDYTENVSINNLLAATNRFARDLQGNQFLSQVILSPTFYQRVYAACTEASINLDALPRDKYSGHMHLINQTHLYTWGEPTCLLHTPHNSTTWELSVGETHQLTSRDTAFLLLGKNCGFDSILPYNPYDSDPYRRYAPPRLLAQWIDEGYESAAAVAYTITALPPGEKLLLLSTWERAGYTDSRDIMLSRGLAAPEELLKLGGEHEPTYRPALPIPCDEALCRTIDGEFTVVSD